MTWPTHTTVALTALWLPYAIAPQEFEQWMGLMALSAILGGLLPDLDAPHSKLQQMELPGTSIRPFALASAAVRLTTGHRGWMHSPAGLLAIAALSLPLVTAVGMAAWLAFLLGYASHLAADALTPSGIPLAGMPLPGRKKRGRFVSRRFAVTTGSEWEELLFVLSASTAMLLAISAMAEAIQI